MTNVDAGVGDRLALAVLVQYRMATTEQMHLAIAPQVRIEQTRRRLAKLRGRPPKAVLDRTAARLRVGHALTVTETGLTFLKDARRRGDVCQPLDWIPETHHPVGGKEAVVPDALMYYQRGPADDDGDAGAMLQAFVEIDRATTGPERLAATLTTYARLHTYTSQPAGRQPDSHQEQHEAWRHTYPFFPRLLFVLDGTGPTGIATRITALHTATGEPSVAAFLREVPALAAPLADLLRDGPSAPVWRPLRDPARRVGWMHCAHL
ncbi:replication-relaxation family protein [Streptomyces sp. NPDC002265]|uniref:replication-relaxation family protein n=1 Tax=Streptomyces sp. NPDC002265 TaxID=3154415 RepID=UPI00331C060E